MGVSIRWVRIHGKWMLSITLPDHQHVTIDPAAGWTLLLSLRAAMRVRPPDVPDNR